MILEVKFSSSVTDAFNSSISLSDLPLSADFQLEIFNVIIDKVKELKGGVENA